MCFLCPNCLEVHQFSGSGCGGATGFDVYHAQLEMNAKNEQLRIRKLQEEKKIRIPPVQMPVPDNILVIADDTAPFCEEPQTITVDNWTSVLSPFGGSAIRVSAEKSKLGEMIANEPDTPLIFENEQIEVKFSEDLLVIDNINS